MYVTVVKLVFQDYTESLHVFKTREGALKYLARRLDEDILQTLEEENFYEADDTGIKYYIDEADYEE